MATEEEVELDDILDAEPEDSEASSNEEEDGGRKAQREKSKLQREPTERLARTVCVSNLPTDIKKKEISRFVRPCGQVESVRLRGGIPSETNVGRVAKRIAMIKREFGEECHSLRAYVVFEELAAVEKALKLSGTELRGRHVFVDNAHRSSTSVRYNYRDTVFVGNLPFARVDDEALIRFFSGCGSIRRVRIVRDRDTGQSRGFAYVEFTDRAAVHLALQRDGTQLEGRALRVSRCHKAAKKSEKQPKSSKSHSKPVQRQDSAKSQPTRPKKQKFMQGDRQQKPGKPNPQKKRPKKQRTKTNRSANRFYLPTSIH